MKIAHLTFSLLNGGKENLLVDLANAQVQEGHQVCIAILNDRADNALLLRIDPRIRLRQFRRNRRSMFWLPAFFAFFMFRYRASIFHCHDESMIRLVRFLGGRHFLTMHGLEFSARTIKDYDCIVGISDTVGKALAESGLQNIITIKNAIDVHNVRRISAYTKPGYLKLVQVGNLMCEYKGQDLALKAVDILCNEMNLQNVSLFMIGEGHSRPLLEKMISDRNLNDKIVLLGSQERSYVRQNLCGYHIMLQPSRMEGFGLTVVEGLAAGLPVVAADTEGPAEILQQGKYGYLFRAGDERSLALQLRKAIDDYGSGMFIAQRELARQHAIENYDLSQMTREYLSAYQRN